MGEDGGLGGGEGRGEEVGEEGWGEGRAGAAEDAEAVAYVDVAVGDVVAVGEEGGGAGEGVVVWGGGGEGVVGFWDGDIGGEEGRDGGWYRDGCGEMAVEMK